MGALEKALTELNEVERMACTGSRMHSIDPRAKLIVTVIYIVAVLSFSLDSPAGIILFWVFPIIVSAMSRISYNAVFVKSLYTLPFIMFIGIFNPIFNREPMLYIGDMAISRGWVEFVSIIIRGLLSVQAVLLLIMSTGFNRLCAAMGKLGVPSIFTTQLMLLYRYIFVLLDEALSMDRARKSRSYGRKKYGLKDVGHVHRAAATAYGRTGPAHTPGDVVARFYGKDIDARQHALAALRHNLRCRVVPSLCGGSLLRCVGIVSIYKIA